MILQYLDFEKPIIDLENRLEQLRRIDDGTDKNLREEIGKLDKKIVKIRKEIFSNLTRWQITQLARHPNRPYMLDYINHCFKNFLEIHGDRAFRDDPPVVCGFAELEGEKGMAAGMSQDADPARLIDQLGERWALVETSLKYHAACRHAHPAAAALLLVISQHDLKAEAIKRVTAHVHQGAMDILGPIVTPQTTHQAIFSMGTVLGLSAVFRRAGVQEFESHFNDARIAAFREKVHMVVDPEVDQLYPLRWIGKVTVDTEDGRTVQGRVDEPKGDPGNTLTRGELEQKALLLAQFSGAASVEEISRVLARIWDITRIERVGRFLT